VLQRLAADENFRSRKTGPSTLQKLAQQVGAAGRDEELSAVVPAIESLVKPDRPLASELVLALARGADRTGRPLTSRLGGSGQTAALLHDAIESARKAAADATAPSVNRAAAVRIVALDRSPATRDLLASLLGSSQPQEVQVAAIAALDRFQDPEIGPILLRAWPELTPSVRTAAADALYARNDRLVLFLEAVEKGKIPSFDLDRTRIKLLGQS